MAEPHLPLRERLMSTLRAVLPAPVRARLKAMIRVLVPRPLRARLLAFVKSASLRASQQPSRVGIALALACLVIVASCFTFLTKRSFGSAALSNPTSTVGDTHAPLPDNLTLAQMRSTVGLDFTDYYQQHAGELWLGEAITPELSDGFGVEQIFTGGVLRMRANAPKTIAPFSVVSQLVDEGATITLGETTSVTYESLRSPSDATDLVAAPKGWNPGGDATKDGLFIPIDTSGSTPLGHFISGMMMSTLLAIPEWQSVIGKPISESQVEPVITDGLTHAVTVQAFERAVLYFDSYLPDKTSVSYQPVGADYLAITGLPKLATTGRLAWTAGASVSVMSSPGSNAVVGTLLANFALTLDADTVWQDQTLWYHVSWAQLAGQRDGWVSATQLRFIAPSESNQVADITTLSPDLGSYVDTQGDDVALVVYLPSVDRYYVHNPDLVKEMDSTFKIPILVTLLAQHETSGTPLSQDDQDSAYAMITVSDNVAFGELYDAVGQDQGIYAYMSSIGITDISVNTDGIGSTLLSPLSMTKILEDLRTHAILTPADCDYVLSLMSQITPSQQFGVGDSVAPDATYAMKDGYDIAIDGLWEVNTVGIITKGSDTYIVSLYTSEHTSLDDGKAMVNLICGDITRALLGEEPKS